MTELVTHTAEFIRSQDERADALARKLGQAQALTEQLLEAVLFPEGPLRQLNMDYVLHRAIVAVRDWNGGKLPSTAQRYVDTAAANLGVAA